MRRAAFVSLVATAVAVVACGRQVTPNPPGLGPGGAPPGYLAIHFDVAQPFNFNNYQYMVVFNTTGNGVTPSTDTLQKNWAGYSFALIGLGRGGVAYGQAVQFIFSAQNPHQPPTWFNLITPPQLFSFNPDSNGTGTEFSMLAQRTIFKGIPTASPVPIADVWTFNAFTTQASSGGPWTFVDSLGAGGPVDPQFVSPNLCMTEPFDVIRYGSFAPSDPAAQIASVEISNNPTHPTPCP